MTYVPGERFSEAGVDAGLASTAAGAALNEIGLTLDVASYRYPAADDAIPPWTIVDTFGGPGFDETIACVKGLCMKATDAAEHAT